MSWLNHPRYVPVRDALISRLRAKIHLFRRTPPIVFLCGAHQSLRRDRIADYLRRFTPALVFFADDVWLQIARTPDLNALQMESELAELADMVAIVVESPGTFTELGAFGL